MSFRSTHTIAYIIAPFVATAIKYVLYAYLNVLPFAILIPKTMEEWYVFLLQSLIFAFFTTSFLFSWYHHRHNTIFSTLLTLYIFYAFTSLLGALLPLPQLGGRLFLAFGAFEVILGIFLLRYLWQHKLVPAAFILLPYVILHPFGELLLLFIIFHR
jgi:hypothetical protein